GGQVIPGKYPQAASSLIFRSVNGKFQPDAENSAVVAGVGLVNGAVWSGLDGDGLPELVLATEWGPLRMFRNRAGRLQDETREWGLAELTGLWTGVAAGDFDGDGRMDLVAGNWGLNSMPGAARPANTPSPIGGEGRGEGAPPLVLFYGDL